MQRLTSLPASPPSTHLALAALVLLGALSLGLGGCGGESEPAPEVVAPPRPPPVDELEVAMRAREETEAYALTPYAEPYRVSLARGERQSFSTALREGFCYKLLVEGGPASEEIDLFLYDPNGVLSQLDAREGNDPVLGTERPICPFEPGLYRVEVRMVRGEGPLLAQWYANQSL